MVCIYKDGSAFLGISVQTAWIQSRLETQHGSTIRLPDIVLSRLQVWIKY